MTIAFIRRSQPVPGEVTVRIHQDADAILGEVSSPGGIEGTAAAEADGALGVHQALASAIALAEKHGSSVGVIDDDELWREEWGDLQMD